MAESLPSKKISVADVPEVLDFRANFVYNFYTPDEKINSFGNAPTKFLQRPSETFTADFIETLDFNRFTPRYVEFFWQPIVVGNKTSNTANGLKFQRNDIATKISIKENLQKIYYEDDFSFKDYTSLHFQDIDTSTTMQFIVKKAYENMVGNSSNNNSLQDKAKALNAATSTEVGSNLLSNSFNSFSALNINFFDRNKQQIINDKIRKLGNVKSSIQINNKLIQDILSTAAFEDNINPLTNETKTILDNSKNIQEVSCRTRDSNLITTEEYDFQIDKPYTSFELNSSGHDSILQTIGYIIEKYEVLPDGTIDTLAPIIVETPEATTTVDLQVKYDATYFYQIRTVAYIEIQAYNLETNKIMVVGFLVASKPKRTLDIKCEELSPPPPPSDFNITWDYTKNLPRILWSFPPNTQRDIKYFQIFRREAINQPFQLIKMYDFNDSIIKTEPNENLIHTELIEKVYNPNIGQTTPPTFFYDQEFTKESSYIYALCSIDAHGLSSNYSMQLHIKFDKITSKLIVQLISIAGAPKPYPNVYINVDSFVDTIKDEGHKQIKIIFNPEYIRVFNSQNQDLELLKTNSEDFYQLQLINVDLQQEQKIKISLKDKRVNYNNQQPGNTKFFEK